jgi:hypothetical protein
MVLNPRQIILANFLHKNSDQTIGICARRLPLQKLLTLRDLLLEKIGRMQDKAVRAKGALTRFFQARAARGSLGTPTPRGLPTERSEDRVDNAPVETAESERHVKWLWLEV